MKHAVKISRGAALKKYGDGGGGVRREGCFVYFEPLRLLSGKTLSSKPRNRLQALSNM